MHCGRMDEQEVKADDVDEESLAERNRGGIVLCENYYRIDTAERSIVQKM